MITHRSYLFLFLCAIFLFICVLNFRTGHNPTPYSKQFQQMNTETEQSKRLDPMLCFKYKSGTIDTIEDISKVTPRTGKSIFFQETSCRSRNANKVSFTIREACAIETAAKENPLFDVYVLVTAPAVIKNEGTREDIILQKLIETYPNIHIKHMFVEDYVKDTPVEELFESGKLEKSNWIIQHLSDVLRYVTLWKYGGIYLDLDVFVLKSLQDLPPNFSALQSTGSIAVGAMGFARDGIGHKIMDECLKEQNRDYRPDIWTYNSIRVLEKVLKNICNNTKIMEMTPEKCQGFQLFTQNNFYPLYYTQIDMFFLPIYLNAAKHRIEGAYALHLWNKLSESRPLLLNNTNLSLIEVVAREHCPNVYKLCENKFQ